MQTVRLAFVSGLNDKKLAQKLAPLQALPEVEHIHLYRRQTFSGDKIHWMRIPYSINHFKFTSEVWRILILLLNARRYDVLIGCHQRFHGVYAAIAGLLWNRPVIQLTITDPAWMEQIFLGKWALLSARAIGFRGWTTMRRFREKHGDKKLLFVVQNAWNPPHSVPFTEKRIDLLYVGNHQSYKNLPGWLRVAAQVKQHRGQLRARLVGNKPNQKLLTLARQLHIVDDVEFSGPLYGKDLDNCYAQARVLLLTSYWEGMPMVIAEAMAAGVPVVATDVGDIADVIQHGENGFLTRAGDVEAAVQAVMRLLDDQVLYQRMAESACNSLQQLAQESKSEHLLATWRTVFRSLGLISHSLPAITR